MKQYDYQEEVPEIIDVPSYETVSDEELFGKQEDAQPAQTEEEFEAMSRAVMADPARCFCRNCGKPVLKEASVCVNCRYVLNPAGLQMGMKRLQDKRKRYEKSHRFFRAVNNLTGVDLESPERKALFEISPQRYAYRTTGAVYCTNCGREVDEGASVCIYCQYVLNPAAVQRAQMAIEDKKAKLTPALVCKSLLIPGFGNMQRKKWSLRRPQIAKPCGVLGKINMGLTTAVALLLIWLL